MDSVGITINYQNYKVEFYCVPYKLKKAVETMLKECENEDSDIISAESEAVYDNQ